MIDTFPPGLADAWNRFLETDAQRRRGLDVYPELFAEPILFPLQRKRELTAMMRSARAIQPRIVVEIGSDKGGGFYHWIKCHPAVELAIAIEIRGVPLIEPMARAFPDVIVRGIAGSSYEMATVCAVREMLDGRPIDCLFLDGEKCFFNLDFDAYLPLMRVGGKVFLHDINPHGTDDELAPPVKVFQGLCQKFPGQTIIDASEAAEIDQPRTAYESWLKFWGQRSCGVGILTV